MFENLFSPYENFKFRDSSSTEAAFGDGPTVALTRAVLYDSGAHLLSPHPLGINYRRVESRGYSGYSTGSCRPAPVKLTGQCAGTVSAACRQAAGTHSPYAVSPEDVLGQTAEHR